MKKAISTILCIILAIVIFIGAYNIIINLCSDIEIHVPTGTSSSGKYFEGVMLSYAHMPERHREKAQNFMDTCGDFHVNFINEHKDDKYRIDTEVSIEDEKTIVTYEGTITDGETGNEQPFHKEIVFDYVFTENIS